MINIFSDIYANPIAIQGEHNIHQYKFELPIFINEINMGNFFYKMDIQKSNGKFNICDLDKEILSDKIILTWNITNTVSDISGELKIQIRGFTSNNFLIWQSEISKVYIKKSINAIEDFDSPIPNEFIEIESKITDIKDKVEIYKNTALNIEAS